MTAAHRPFRSVAAAAALLVSLAIGPSVLADPGAPGRGISLFDEPMPAARESVPRVSSPFYQAPGDPLRAPEITPTAGAVRKPTAPASGSLNIASESDLFGPAGTRPIPGPAAATVPSSPAQSSNRPISLTNGSATGSALSGRLVTPSGGESAVPDQTEPELAKQAANAAAVDYDSLTAPDRPTSPRPRRVVERAPEPAASNGWWTIAYYSALVLGLAFAGYVAAWGVRRQTLPARTGLPDGLLEHVGSRTLGPQTTLHIVRVGTRLLVLGHTPQGLQTLSEIDDPERVSQLMSLAEGSGGDARNLFRRNRPTAGANEAAVRSGIDQQG